MRNTTASMTARHLMLSLLLVGGTVGCGGKHHLEEYPFSERTLALVWIEPPRPVLQHGWWNMNLEGNAVQQVVQAGSKVAKEREARKAAGRLDSASLSVDVQALLAARTIERVNRYLGTSYATTANAADYVLEMNMLSFGIDARSEETTRLFVKAEAVLMDRRTGREIWSEEVRGTDRLTPFVIGTNTIPSEIVNAVSLRNISVEQFRQALEQLVSFTATRITDELREDLRDVRDR